MATLTIEVPDDLMERLSPLQDQLPELLQRCLDPVALPAQVYRYVLDFLASQPTADQLGSFRPTAEMQQRLRALVEKEQGAGLSEVERQELAEYERLEHLIVMLKADALLKTQRADG